MKLFGMNLSRKHTKIVHEFETGNLSDFPFVSFFLPSLLFFLSLISPFLLGVGLWIGE